ncbi:putative polyketide synthase [Mycena venus]|uniref:Putative polyketide synthase n=1 Tax=Mycena venus TaxID=2733690 RepID=A0A8H6YBP8_9AGAR|nr:putative polyketide synthase [Mycena venus]
MASPIAIVGISAELPSGIHSEKNLDHNSFFEFLLDSKESYEPMPSTRFDTNGLKGNGIGQIIVENGSFLNDIDLFDNVEFGISSRDARAMAPATRKLLEHSFLALLDSGIDYRKQNVGCFMSGTSIDLSNVSTPDEYESRGSLAGAPAMVANRVSNHLDLLGPSIPVDTACSSSLMALHIAVQSILLGDCNAAVVGGCQLNHRLTDWITYSQSSLLAEDGKCKPFDESANGFARAEACVVIVIKPLEHALKDQDHIYATILGSSINSTGSGGPPGAPVAESQADAMSVAFKRAGRSPSEVAYVELHATGTAKGDPTEANWVGQHFQRPNPLLIGSVKGNIGHTEIAAFLASLSKVISIFEHNVIPPNVNLVTLNPAIKWLEYNLRVPVNPTPLPSSKSGKPLISMSGSGIGGSNGHVVLEAPPPGTNGTADLEQRSSGPILLMAAGLSPRSASAIADQLLEMFKTAPSSDYLAASITLGRRAKQMTWRSYAISDPGTGSTMQFPAPQHSPRDPNTLVFIFSGQGPQHEQMGRELFRTFPVFRRSILDMDVVFQRLTHKSMIHDYGIFGGASPHFAFSSASVWPIAVTLPAIAMFQMALFDLLVHFGVSPDIVVGHSAGETAVLYASGAAPKAMALELAIIRGQIFTPLETSQGTMAALSCTSMDAERLLAQQRCNTPEGIVELACLNSPSAVAISGQEVSIDGVLHLAEQNGIFARKIRTRVPIHSSMMDVCRDQYLVALRGLFDRYKGPYLPKIPTYSTLTGDLFRGPFDPEYFWMNTRYQVLFAPAVQNINRASTFVEIAPHPVLASYLSDSALDSSVVLPTVRRPKAGATNTENYALLELLGKLTVSGYNCVDFAKLNGAAESQSKPSLPVYPFQKRRFPLYPEGPQSYNHCGPINRSHLRLNRHTHPTLSEHVIRGEPIWPASGFLEMALEFGATTLMNVNLRAMLPLSAENPSAVNVTLDGAYWKVTSSILVARPTKGSDDGDSYIHRLHADGYLSFEAPPIYDNLNISEIRKRCDSHVASAEFYPSLSYFSSYGPKFQRVTNMYFNSDEALASINGIVGNLISENSYILHPAVLDACFQIAAYKPFNGNFSPNSYYLPSRIGELILHGPTKTGYFPPHIYAHVRLREWMPESMRYDVTVVDDFGQRLCTLRDLEVAKHQLSPYRTIPPPLHIVNQPAFQTVQREMLVCGTKSAGDGTVCLLGSSFDQVASEQDALEPHPSNFITFDDFLESAMAANGHRLRNAVRSFSPTGEQRLVRICILSDADKYISHVKAILTEFPHLAFEISVSDTGPVTEAPVHPFTVFRHETNISDRGNNFDIIVAFGQPIPDSDHDDSDSVIDLCDIILLPGGTLVFTDLNRGAWDHCLPGSTWYKSTFGKPPPPHLAKHLVVLEQLDYSIIDYHYFPTSSPFHFTIEAQKPTWSPDSNQLPSLFNEDVFLFNYKLGGESQLQWDFSGLAPSQELDIWIVASEGADTAAGLGLVRALRREYMFWNIRFISFPENFEEERRMHCLRNLPLCIGTELDIVFSQQGDPLVPRLLPLVVETEARRTSSKLIAGRQPPPPDRIVVCIHCTSRYPEFSALVATVIQPNLPEYPQGSLVIGLQHHAFEGRATIDAGASCIIPAGSSSPQSVVDDVPGVIVSILGAGLSMWKRSHRLAVLRILITNCDTFIGSTVVDIYRREGLEISQTMQSASMLDLARMGFEQFDLVISGYEEQTHVQILCTLLRPPTGRLFLWQQELPRIIREEPCSIGDALRFAASRGFLETRNLGSDPLGSEGGVLQVPFEIPTVGSVFDAEKAYIILGGIGSVGAHVALSMAQHGARHIIVTSRSGEQGLFRKKNLIVRRIFAYLKSLDYLDIRLTAVDATSPASMADLFGSIDTELGGCIILTAVLADGLFPTLSNNDFTTVFASKTGVLESLQKAVKTSTFEFVIAFSSMTSVFGTGGQAGYCAANAALEDETASLPNGFSFVCPGILDSELMRSESHENRLKHLTEWSISAEEMLLWLDDAICKYRSGVRFQRYIPNVDWEAMDRSLGMTKIGAHLVRSSTQEIPIANESILSKASVIVRSVLNIAESDFNVDMPLTSYGVDSLSASRLSFALRSILEVTQIQLLADTSVAELIRKVPHLSSNSDEVVEVNMTESSVTSLMDELVAKFTDMTKSVPQKNPASQHCKQDTSSPHVVLLTGSTGALGSHILAHLLANDRIQLVYALNRKAPDGIPTVADRQQTALENQGLPPTLLNSPKLKIIEGDFCADDFGIPSQTMDLLLSSVTHIIHNAWKVDLMARLPEFEDLIAGTHRLLEFAMRSSDRPSFTFISTIGVYQNLPPSILSGPEEPISDAKIAAQTGYLESKWVAERLVHVAVERRYLNANIIRVGLLTGGTNGSWDTSHWFPALAQTGVHIGCLPDGNDQISWIPTNYAAAAIVDMRTCMNKTLHLVHPRPTIWKAVLEPLASSIGVPLVPYAEWFARLKHAAENSPHRTRLHDSLAALRLLDFFRLGLKPAGNTESMGLLPRVMAEKGIHASKTLMDENLPPLGSTDVAKWMSYWRGVRFL